MRWKKVKKKILEMNEKNERKKFCMEKLNNKKIFLMTNILCHFKQKDIG